MTECDVSIQTEHRVFVHFYQNNISCSCTVTSLFDGEVHVMFSKTENRKKCYNNYKPYSVKVNDTVIKDCYGEEHTMFNVQSNDIVIVKAEYIENNNSMITTPCLEIYGKYSNRYVIRQKLDISTTCRCISLFLNGKLVYVRYYSTYKYMYLYYVPVFCIYDGIKTVVRQKY